MKIDLYPKVEIPDEHQGAILEFFDGTLIMWGYGTPQQWDRASKRWSWGSIDLPHLRTTLDREQADALASALSRYANKDAQEEIERS